jgi:hypothetical protein
MGQYYLLINLDKRERMWSLASFTRFSSGQKMREQLLNLGMKPFLALALFEFEEAIKQHVPNPLWGSWSGDRIVLIGDYSDDRPDFLSEAEVTELDEKGLNLYQLAWNEFRELADDHRQWIQSAAELPALLSGSTHHVIVNLDNKEYLDPEGFGDDLSVDNFSLEREGVLKGLFSCLFHSSGSGGGDIAEFRNGRWAGDRLKIVAKHLVSWEYVDMSEEISESVQQYS